jgi:hypothetical protein
MLRLRRRSRLAVVLILAVGALATGLLARQGRGGGGPLPAPPGIPGQALQPPVEGTGAISGVVADGTTGRPLAGAVVTLSGSGRGAPGTKRQSTDDKGRFIFTKLPAFDGYSIAVSRIGYFVARLDRRITLADGQWFADAKIALSKLGAISGVVTDETGEPVVGAFVRVLARVLVSGLPQLAAGPVARTDDRGVYRIPALSPGKYLVAVPSVQWSVPAETPASTLNGQTPESAAAAEAAGRPLPQRNDQTLNPDGRDLLFLGAYTTPPAPAGGRSLVYPITFYPAVRSPAESVVIDLVGGEERTGIDLQLRAVNAVRVSGLVEGPADAQAAGMTLRLLPAGMEGMANGGEAATALVGASGAFTFLNVPAGDYTILASRSQMEYQAQRSVVLGPTLPTPPAYVFGSSGGGVVPSGSTGTNYNYRQSTGPQTHSGRTSVTVGDRDLSGVVVPLSRGTTVSGRIVYEMTTPPPPESSTFMLPVYAEPADGSTVLGMPSGRVKPNGAESTFAIDGLQAGLYTLRFVAVANGGRIKSIVMDGKDYTNRPFDASGGRDLTGVVVTVTDKSVKLAGSVRDAQGRLADHGAVMAFPVEPEQWRGYGFTPRRIASVSVTTAGSYQYPSLMAGDYFVIAVDEALATAWQDPKFLAAASSVATRVTLEWGDAKAIDLTLRPIPGFSRIPRF